MLDFKLLDSLVYWFMAGYWFCGFWIGLTDCWLLACMLCGLWLWSIAVWYLRSVGLELPQFAYLPKLNKEQKIKTYSSAHILQILLL